MLSNRSRILVPAFLGLSLVVAGGAKADMITYSITTTSSGSLGSDRFSDAEVTLSFVGDTANIVNAEPGVFYNSLGTATVMVANLGTATFTTPISVYAYQPGSAVGFFNGSSFSSNQYTLGVLNLTAAAYATYDLSTSFAPAFGGSFTSFTPAGFATDHGAFVLEPRGGSFTASLRAVPEPTSLLMLGTGAVGLLGYARRRKATKLSADPA